MPDRLSTEELHEVLDAARWAPSVHNTQPWKVKVDADKFIILPDAAHKLVYGDPTGRQAFISRGIFTEACIIALGHAGFTAPKPKLEGEAIILKLSSTAKLGRDEDISALKDRFTDRTVYKKMELPVEVINKIKEAWSSSDVSIAATNDRKIIEKTAELTRQALSLAFSNPDFRKELTDYFVAKPSAPYGIPLSTLGTGKLKARAVKQLIRSGLNRKQEAQLEYERWSSASGLVFILAGGDSKPYWLESGRAYLRASLELQKLGLSQATSAAIVEAADFHEDIEKMLGTEKRIECVIRFGLGQRKRRPSGRLAPEQLLVT